MAAALESEGCNRGGGQVIERDTQPRSGGEARRGEARRWCLRCGVVGREVKRLAALGCSLQRQQPA